VKPHYRLRVKRLTGLLAGRLCWWVDGVGGHCNPTAAQAIEELQRSPLIAEAVNQDEHSYEETRTFRPR
jgi:hypothetical protein